jgi:DUF2905 family protein
MNLTFQLGKFMLVAGVLLVAAGLLFMAGAKFPSLNFGRLPGDIVYRGKNTSFFFPIVTCLVLSVVLTLVLWLVSFLTRK